MNIVERLASPAAGFRVEIDHIAPKRQNAVCWHKLVGDPQLIAVQWQRLEGDRHKDSRYTRQLCDPVRQATRGFKASDGKGTWRSKRGGDRKIAFQFYVSRKRMLSL